VEDPLMIDKPDHLKLIDAAASDDPYDLSKLRVNPEALEGASVRKILTTVPVRKPNKQDFVRVRPEPQHRETLALIELRDERETYIVDLVAVPELQSEVYLATVFTAINRLGTLFLWPIKIPTGGRVSDWHTSAASAVQHAMRTWIRVQSDMDLGAYVPFEAAGDIPPPVWPDHTFSELIRLGFKDKVIRDLNHPIAKRLRGE
jgi:hypothetical protein